jgi:hypothetical protein
MKLFSNFLFLGHRFIKKYSWQSESVCTQSSECKKEIVEIVKYLRRVNFIAFWKFKDENTMLTGLPHLKHCLAIFAKRT